MLTGVAATSGSNAWAVGDYNTGLGTPLLALAEHWNGTTWALAPIQNPGTGSPVFNYVMSVAATSASNAWAVGMHSTSQEGTLTLIEHQFKTSQVKLDASLMPDLPPILGNSGKLQQVFLNLFLNAKDAMSGGGTLRIATEMNGHVSVAISDTGSAA